MATPAKKAPAKKAAAKKTTAKKAAPKPGEQLKAGLFVREERKKPTSQSPRYTAVAGSGEVKPGPEPKVHDQDVTSSDPNRKIPGGSSPYLDEVERRNAEIARARVENREPDLENPPAVQGTPLTTKE